MKAKYWVLEKKFKGIPTEENLKLVEEELRDDLKPNEILLQAIYLSVDPYMRVFTDNLKEGEVMIGEQLAEVIKSRNGAYPVGSMLLNKAGWRSHFISNGSNLEWIPFDLNGSPYSYTLSVLGMPGAAAYIGLNKFCEPKSGETVLINAAAGAVGCLVGQFAKLRGCNVIAFAGSDEKVSWCKNELNFDHVYNYKKVNIQKAIKEAAPDGVDIFFDNVGGKFYNEVISNHIKPYGRICICGSIENYNDGAIKKSVNIIKEMKEDAKTRGVQIDQQVTNIADQQCERLLAERNLRFELDNLDVGECNIEEVKTLQELVETAREKGVASNYLDSAEILKGKMARSIQTKEIFMFFQEYPVRPSYTSPIELDPKTKKPWDPDEKKFVDIKLLLAPKKKPKKKEPKFIIPEWATEIPDMEKKIKTIEELLKSAAELELKQDFLKECEEQITRMKRELKHRKALKREEEIIAELRATQKKKK